MILRRVIEHVKAQNWTAVGLDFVIVVIGVFMGIQLGNWNEARNERDKEAAFRERLLEDVELARGRVAEFLTDRERRLAAIMRVEDMYFGAGEVEPLSEQECLDFADAHIITYPPAEAPSITEAFTAGRIDLLTDTTLVRALIEVEQHEDRLRTVIEAMNRDRPVFHRMFPDAISKIRAITPDDDPDGPNDIGYRDGAECHFIGKEPDPAFLSEVVEAASLNANYVAFLRAHARRLDAVSAMLNGPS